MEHHHHQVNHLSVEARPGAHHILVHPENVTENLWINHLKFTKDFNIRPSSGLCLSFMTIIFESQSSSKHLYYLVQMMFH